MPVTIEALDHLVMNVKDVETAAAWYERVLGMKRVVTEPRPGAKVTSMHFGRQKINLRPETATQKQWFTGRTIAPGSDDLCFLTKSDAAAGGRSLQELRRHDRRRAGREEWRHGHHRLGLLPRSRRQPDRGLLLQAGLTHRLGDVGAHLR